MAIEPNEHQRTHRSHRSPQSFSLDALYCEEERWGDVDGDVLEVCESNITKNVDNVTLKSSLLSLFLLEQDLFWEDEELLSLFAKEKETHVAFCNIENEPALCAARGRAVEWILKVNAYYGFSTLTAILAINYLDRFLSSLHFQKDKPWMIQLVSVTCLSLAAKVEETQVPLLLDFQVGDSTYLFEAKTIQKMELLMLSALKWRMNPVTPISFLDHIIRRLGLKNHLHWEFLRQCESLLVSVVADSRFVRYQPSVLAAATMLHVIHQVEPYNAIDYQNQLLGVLKISKKQVNDCYELISQQLSDDTTLRGQNSPNKRKFDQFPSSPSGVIDTFFNSDSSNDSWSVESSVFSPKLPVKRMRIQEQQMSLSSLSSRAFMELVSSPR